MKILTNTILVIFFALFGLFSYKILYVNNDWILKKSAHSINKPAHKRNLNKSSPVVPVQRHPQVKQHAEISRSAIQPSQPSPVTPKRNYFYRLTLIDGGEINGTEAIKEGNIIQINSRSGISTRVNQQEIQKVERIDIITNKKEKISLMALVKDEQ